MGNQALQNKLNEFSLFAYNVAVGMAGGESVLCEEELKKIYDTCAKSERLKTLAGMYLVGDSSRAEHNLKNLKHEVQRVFHIY